MKSIKALTFLLFISAATYAQRTEVRDVNSFDEISYGISGNLYIKQGSSQSVELKGDSEDLEEVITEVRGGRLVIKNRSNNWFSWTDRNKVDVYVTIKTLKGIKVSGSGRAYGESKFKTDYIDLSVSGAGRLELYADAGEMDISISGSGKMDLEGSARDLDVSISGSGGLNLEGEGTRTEISISGSGRVSAENFIAQSHRIRISGSGSCRIHADDEIDARISGSGSVYYKGDARKVNSHSSGSGKVRRL